MQDFPRDGERLGWTARIAFGAGDFAQNLVYPAVSMYLLFFYTNVIGIAPAAAAAIFLAVQLLDLAWSPFVGVLIDRFGPPKCRYRLCIALAGLPLYAFAIWCFSNPFWGVDGNSKIAYAAFTYAVFSMLFSAVNVAYGALGSSLSRDVGEQTVLTSVRIFMANAGCFLAAAGVPLLVGAFAGCRAVPGQMSLFMALGILPSFAFMPLVPWLRRRLGKRRLFFVFATVAAAGMAALYVLSRIGRVEDRLGWVYAAQFVKATGIVVATGYMWALVPEVVTYSEHLTGRRISGVVNAIMGAFFRVGMAIGKVVPGMVLAWTGYRASAAEEALPVDPAVWRRAIAVFAAGAIASLVFSVCHARERFVMDASRSAEVKPCELWREFRRNAPLRVLALFFVVVYAMMSISNAAGAYFIGGLDAQSPAAREGVRWLVCVIPAILVAAASAVIARYPLSDGRIDRLNREIRSRTEPLRPTHQKLLLPADAG